MGHPELANPAMAPDVINNSWDCPTTEGCSLTTLQAVENAVASASIFQSMAAGNYGPNCSTVKTTPAIYGAGLGVGATDSSKMIASFSSRGPSVPHVLGLNQGVFHLSRAAGNAGWLVTSPVIAPAAGNVRIVRGDPARRALALDEFEQTVRALAGGAK